VRAATALRWPLAENDDDRIVVREHMEATSELRQRQVERAARPRVPLRVPNDFVTTTGARSHSFATVLVGLASCASTGAYLEPPNVAYPRRVDVVAGAGYTAVATHYERLIEQAVRFAEQHGIGRDRFEFQLLYGVRPQLQLELVRRGFKVLVATPYGP
jgi:hypothetical protein